jgi:hypothetical protein
MVQLYDCFRLLPYVAPKCVHFYIRYDKDLTLPVYPPLYLYCALLSIQKMKIVKVDSITHNWLCNQRPGLCLPVLEG